MLPHDHVVDLSNGPSMASPRQDCALPTRLDCHASRYCWRWLSWVTLHSLELARRWLRSLVLGRTPSSSDGSQSSQPRRPRTLPVDFASASPRQVPSSTSSKLPLLVRSTSLLTHDTTGSLPDCQRARRNTDSNVSAILPTAPNMSRGRMMPTSVLLASRLNHSILIEYKDILIR